MARDDEDPLTTEVFGREAPYRVGIEEELFLVDPLTGAQINASGAVVERLGPVAGAVERELHACQVELVSPVSDTAGQAIDSLARMRAAVLDTGTGLLGAGTHPSAPQGEAQITDKERYERIRDLLGDAVLTPVGGLHVHVGIADPESAIRAYNGLREHLPLLQALSANSPFRHGRDTGLASAREVTMREWPRSGVPRAFDDYADFCALATRMTRAAGVPDYTWFWWKLRPHPRLGTVEVRSLDAQTELADVAALAALVHCLAVVHAEGEPVLVSPPDVIEEGLHRAARYGIDAHLPDRDGAPRPLGSVLERALQACEPVAAELGCGEELGGLERLVADGGGAGRQRAVHDVAGMGSLLRRLLELTARPALPDRSPVADR